MRRLLATALVLLAIPSSQAAQEYSVTGMVLKVDRARLTFTASIQAIPGFMAAMAMPFEVRQAKDLDGLVPGASVAFALVVNGNTSYAERIRVVRYQSTEQDPLAASRLKLLTQVAGRAPTRTLAIGETVPDFRLIDQRRQPISLSALRGKVVAINFIYTSCALLNFRLRIANNFGVLQKRFQARLGRDLVPDEGLMNHSPPYRHHQPARPTGRQYRREPIHCRSTWRSDTCSTEFALTGITGGISLLSSYR